MVYVRHLLDLLSRFNAYVTTGNSVSAITTAEMEIKLKEDKIICHNPYRMALSEREKSQNYNRRSVTK
jgi:hypothetical protein